ncbi:MULTISPECIES: hypothetical protein [unclassified Streptomyces]|uniref:hypothetical protein n=1 Tax=unclassified Streptomyces TaxID=2593676 RepID=UPI0032543201
MTPIEPPCRVTAHLALIGDVEGERVVKVAHPHPDHAPAMQTGVVQQDVQDFGDSSTGHGQVAARRE